jgi:hypothetical protein
LERALRVDGPPERVGEDEIPVDVGVSHEVTLEDLCFAVLAQRRDRHGVQRDRPGAAPALGRAERRAALGRDELLHDLQPRRVHVDVLPAQAE